MKSRTSFAEITNQKAETHLSERGKLESTCLLALCQLRNFLREFTENCFVVFDESNHVIYLMWYRSLLFFLEFTPIILFMV